MIGLDTNVLVRYIAQDDVKQSPMATACIESYSESNRGFISLVSLVELVWVMQRCYAASKDETVALLDKLLRVRTLSVENADLVVKALNCYTRSNADFADCLIERAGHDAGCKETVTFDSRAAQTANMQLLR